MDGFYSFLGFTRLTSNSVIRKAIARGVQEGRFGYSTGAAPEIRPDGKYQVSLAKVRFATAVSEDEIDLESGFLMMPQAIPQPAPAPPSSQQPGGETTSSAGGLTGGGAPGTEPVTSRGTGVPTTPTTPPGFGPQKMVEIAFSADRNQLFTAWDALANLADLAGKVSVKVTAESTNGFDRNKLQNGVLEPLREADLID